VSAPAALSGGIRVPGEPGVAASTRNHDDGLYDCGDLASPCELASLAPSIPLSRAIPT
jgi:hypothetical protein